MAGKIKQTRKFVEGLEVKHLEALARIASTKDIGQFYALIRLKKFEILRQQFDFSYNDPMKNALHKARMMGQDEALTFVVNAFKKAGDLLDQLEEEKESK